MNDRWRENVAEAICALVLLGGIGGALYLVNLDDEARRFFAFAGALVLPCLVAWGVRQSLRRGLGIHDS
jgi:hypothetical protein